MNLNRSKTLLVIGMISLSTLALAACSSTNADAETSANTEPSETQGGDAQRQMGVSGKIAVASDGLLQVQDSESQTAVTYTDSTEITQQIEGAISDVVVGMCVSGFGSDGDDAVLSSISITDPVDGECSAGFGGMGAGGGAPGGEAPEGATPPADGEMPEMPDSGEMPEGAEAPEGMPEGGFGGGANGKVTAVDGQTITIESTSTDGSSSSQEISVDDETSYTKTVQAEATDLEVGRCVVAIGEYDGAEYAATSLAVSDATDNECTTGFGAGRGPGDAAAEGTAS